MREMKRENKASFFIVKSVFLFVNSKKQVIFVMMQTGDYCRLNLKRERYETDSTEMKRKGKYCSIE